MILQEACKLWINQSFSNIPGLLIIRAYKDNPQDLKCLNSKTFLKDNYPSDWPAMWGAFFSPTLNLDEEWIRNNIDIVEKCGILVYNSEECGLLLALDENADNFFDNYWIPLYKARYLKLHQI